MKDGKQSLHGISGRSIELILSYLIDRKQRVRKIENVLLIASWHAVVLHKAFFWGCYCSIYAVKTRLTKIIKLRL